MISHRSLSDSKSSQVFRTLLSILAGLNKAIVCMVSTYPLISKSSSPFNNPLGIVPSAPITIDITVTFMFHRFLVFWQGLAIHLFFSLSFYSVVKKKRTRWIVDFAVLAKSTIQLVLFFFFFFFFFFFADYY